MNGIRHHSRFLGSQRPSKSRGAVMVEYAFLLVAFVIPVMAGLVVGGKQMLRGYQSTRDHILNPFP